MLVFLVYSEGLSGNLCPHAARKFLAFKSEVSSVSSSQRSIHVTNDQLYTRFSFSTLRFF